jgi:hypothetical protein
MLIVGDAERLAVGVNVTVAVGGDPLRVRLGTVDVGDFDSDIESVAVVVRLCVGLTVSLSVADADSDRLVDNDSVTVVVGDQLPVLDADSVFCVTVRDVVRVAESDQLGVTLCFVAEELPERVCESVKESVPGECVSVDCDGLPVCDDEIVLLPAVPEPDADLEAVGVSVKLGENDSVPDLVFHMSGGHWLLEPLQNSSRSQRLTAGRHSSVAGSNASVGHTSDAPLHDSATSQTSSTARQMCVFGCLASAGHAALSPRQFSATSHCPAAARHTIDESINTSTGQEALAPVQNSAISQTSAAARHSNVDGIKTSVGQLRDDPVQYSASSHGPAVSRHIVDDVLKLAVGHATAAPSQ